MSTPHVIKYFFRKSRVPRPDILSTYIKIAHQAMKDRNIRPQAVFIRSDIHDTTFTNGQLRKDPFGFHLTVSYKVVGQPLANTHFTCHAYCSKDGKIYKESVHMDKKFDSVVKNLEGDPVWPDESELWEAPDIGYSILEEEASDPPPKPATF